VLVVYVVAYAPNEAPVEASIIPLVLSESEPFPLDVKVMIKPLALVVAIVESSVVYLVAPITYSMLAVVLDEAELALETEKVTALPCPPLSF